MKCEASLSGYSIDGNYLTSNYVVLRDGEGPVSSVTVAQNGKQSVFKISVCNENDLAAAIGIPLAVALLRVRIEEHLENDEQQTDC